MKKYSLICATCMCLVTAIALAEVPGTYTSNMVVSTKETLTITDSTADTQQTPLIKPTKPADDTDVEDALKVFKKKRDGDDDKETTWYIQNADGSRQIIINRHYAENSNSLLVTPNKDFAFYLDTSGPGGIVYGIDLSTKKEFSVGAADNFTMTTCPDKTNYVVVSKNDDPTLYYIYTTTGTKAKTITYTGSIDSIRDAICY